MIIDVEQGSDEWFNARLGIPTASNFACIMANSITKGEFNPDTAFGNPAKEYAMRKALERKTGKRIETYQNEHMKRGNEQEPIARMLYEQYTFQDVKEVGLSVVNGVGASSDGLVGEKGGIEIKSVIYNTHFKTLKSDSYDLKYKWQIQGNIWLYDLDWVDFVSYCSDFNEEKQLYIKRVERDQVMIDQLESRIELFKEVIKEHEDLL